MWENTGLKHIENLCICEASVMVKDGQGENLVFLLTTDQSKAVLFLFCEWLRGKRQPQAELLTSQLNMLNLIKRKFSKADSGRHQFSDFSESLTCRQQDSLALEGDLKFQCPTEGSSVQSRVPKLQPASNHLQGFGPHIRVLDLLSLGLSTRTCISNDFPKDIDATDPGPCYKNHWSRGGKKEPETIGRHRFQFCSPTSRVPLNEPLNFFELWFSHLTRQMMADNDRVARHMGCVQTWPCH